MTEELTTLQKQQRAEAIKQYRDATRLKNISRQEREAACISLGITMKRYRALEKRAKRVGKIAKMSTHRLARERYAQ